MVWMPPERIAAFQEERRLQKQWQHRNVQQGLRGAKENRMQIARRTLVQTASVLRMPEEVVQRTSRERSEGSMMDIKLFPGIAVVYPSKVRYAAAHEDMLTVDMFDAVIERVLEVTVSSGSVPAMKHGSRPFETMTLLPDEIPPALHAKLAVLDVVRASLCKSPGERAQVPDVGIVFGTGVKWVIVTKEDCDGS